MTAWSGATAAVAGSGDSPLADPRVRAEVAALLYGNAAVGVTMNLLSIPLIWLAYRHWLPAAPLVGSLALWTLCQGISACNRRQWHALGGERQRDPTLSRHFLRRAEWMAWLLSGGMGLLLGVLHFAQPPATPAIAAALALIYVLGATISTLIHLPQIRVFSTVVLGSQAILLALRDDPVEWLLGGLLAALIVGLWSYGRRYSAQLQQVIVLRFEVQDLLAQQQRLRNAAEAANQAKSRFFAAASHDVRQPLQAVMLTFHALRFARTDERRAHLLDVAERNLTALRQLFDQVLDISRIDAGAVPVNPQAVPLQALFDKLDARFASEASAKRLWLRFAPTASCVRTDPDAMERVLANLIGNAIKHTERGGVWVGYRESRQCIEVRDSGAGIASEHHERIFEEFFQVDNAGRDRAGGLGLGLSIVRRLVTLLQHSHGLRSAPERGSTFWIGVPRVAGAADDEAGAALPAQPIADDTPTEPLAGLLIYLIENDAQVSIALEQLLLGAGASVTAFASAASALAAAASSAPFDAVVSDYRLGGALDGVEAVQGLRALWQRDVPAIILTGDTAIRDLTRIDATLHTSEAQARTRLLHKPVPARRLIDELVAITGAQSKTA